MPIAPSILSDLQAAVVSMDASRLSASAMSCLMARPNASEFTNASKALLQRIDRLDDTAGQERVAVLGDCTTQCIAIALPVVLASLGRLSRLFEASFDTWRMEIMETRSGFTRFAPTLTILALSTRQLQGPEPFADGAACEGRAQSIVDEMFGFWRRARERTGTLVIQHNFALPPEAPRGRLEQRYPWTYRRFVRRVNELLWEREGDGVRILDVEGLASRLGEAVWLEPRWYYHSKHPFNPALVADYALALRGTVSTALGLSKKVLVIDLDDTLWGGVVGDVGPEAVEIGPGTPRGEAHFDFAFYIKALKDRGVVLAINSRNNLKTVEQAFAAQKHLPLGLQDFAAVHCHWDAKSLHIREISKELNVGLDSLVFVDDDAFQCEEVRANCPEVVTIQLPDDRAFYVRSLDRLHLFDVAAFTVDDARRTETYRASVAARNAVPEDIDSFLDGLRLVGTCRPVKTEDLDRAEQLFLKTNQFNLSGARPTRADLEKLCTDPDGLAWVCELRDRLTHYGIVAAVAGVIEGDGLTLQNWVTSCRVFSRTFECFILNALAEWAGERGLKRVGGAFRRTDRNQYAKDFLQREGILPSAENSVEEHWNFDAGRRLKTFVVTEGAMHV